MMQEGRLEWPSVNAMQLQISAGFPESLYEPMLWELEDAYVHILKPGRVSLRLPISVRLIFSLKA